jgi:uncharacterized protein (DUF111 family)
MKTKRPRLLVDPARGMAGDMFSAALVSLGVPAEVVIGAMETAARRLGRVSIEPEKVPADGAVAVKLCIRLEPVQPHLPAGQARDYLEEAIGATDLDAPYADFARRTLSILVDAEQEAHRDGRLSVVADQALALSDLEHREMHQQGIAHFHDAHEAVLHEAQDILIDVVGAAVGLRHLDIDLDGVVCLSPVHVGGGFVTFSHGRLLAPAPATQAVLDKCGLPYAWGPVEKELLTPTGVSLLAALEPEFRPRDEPDLIPVKLGIGRGLHPIDPPGDLRLGLWLRD